MAIEVLMPRFGDTMEEGKVLKWLKKVGDKIEVGDIIAEVETDKADMEMEALDAGVLAEMTQDVFGGRRIALSEAPKGCRLVERLPGQREAKVRIAAASPVVVAPREDLKSVPQRFAEERVAAEPVARQATPARSKGCVGCVNRALGGKLLLL